LKDVIVYTFTAFGGAQAHIACMLKDFVQRRKYITESELLELNALSQVLPGPASTQTLVGMAYKVGGLSLSILTFLIWIFPSAAIMTLAAISFSLFNQQAVFERALFFLQPVTIGIVAFAAFKFAQSTLKTELSYFLAAGALISTLILKSAYVFPVLILIGGIVSSALDTTTEETALRARLFANINTRKLIYFLGVLLFFAALGALINRTSPKWHPDFWRRSGVGAFYVYRICGNEKIPQFCRVPFRICFAASHAGSNFLILCFFGCYELKKCRL
jgi:chromate transporter